LAQGIAAGIDWVLIGMVVSLSIGYHGQRAPAHSTAKLAACYALAVLMVWLYFAAMEASAWQATGQDCGWGQGGDAAGAADLCLVAPVG
jgi:hypothetical protein